MSNESCRYDDEKTCCNDECTSKCPLNINHKILKVIMIRKSIEVGTEVFNEIYGFGTFKGWNEDDNSLALINFDNIIKSIPRKNLTEIEPGLNNRL